MLGIVLIILKILGIILLSVLVLFLLLIGSVLFLPIRYQIKAEKSTEGTRGSLYLSWLFQIFRVRVEYEDKVSYTVKILFFQVFPKKKKKKHCIQKEKKKDMTKDKIKESSNNNFISEEKELPKEEETVTKEIVVHEKAESTKQKKTMFQKLQEKLEKLKFTFGKICDKIKKICSGYENFKRFINSEEWKGTLKFLKEQKKYLIRHLKPAKAELYLHFGTEDPALTGEILAILSLLYPFYGYKLEVEPDFEQVCLEAKAFVKGKIQSYVMLLTAWRVYKNRYMRKMIGKLKK